MWAGVAQLVEYKLPKLGVASSNLVARSSVDEFVSVCLVDGIPLPCGEVAMKVGYARFFLCLFCGNGCLTG